MEICEGLAVTNNFIIYSENCFPSLLAFELWYVGVKIHNSIFNFTLLNIFFILLKLIWNDLEHF